METGPVESCSVNIVDPWSSSSTEDAKANDGEAWANFASFETSFGDAAPAAAADPFVASTAEGQAAVESNDSVMVESATVSEEKNVEDAPPRGDTDSDGGETSQPEKNTPSNESAATPTTETAADDKNMS